MLWWIVVVIVSALWLLLCMLVPVTIHYVFTHQERKKLESRAKIEYSELKHHMGYETPMRRYDESDDEFRKRELMVTKSGQKLGKLERRETVITWTSIFIGLVLLVGPMRNVLFTRTTETRHIIGEARLKELSSEIEDVKSGKNNQFGIISDIEEKAIRRVLGIRFTDEKWHPVGTSVTEEYIVVHQGETIR